MVQTPPLLSFFAIKRVLFKTSFNFLMLDSYSFFDSSTLVSNATENNLELNDFVFLQVIVDRIIILLKMTSPHNYVILHLNQKIKFTKYYYLKYILVKIVVMYI